jgi:para-aminobenzoate N-oxygenase AurF
MSRNDVLSHAVEPRLYDSKLKDWYDRSSIRSSARRVLFREDAEGKVYFPPDLVPIAGHDLIRRQDESVAQGLIMQHLYAYLDFTAALEHDVVNRVTQRIAQRRAGFALPRAMLLDAHKIYCDEAYHALFSADIREQIEAVTGVAPLSSTGSSSCLQRLRLIVEGLSPDLRWPAEVCFSVVSETLISAILSQVPRDERVVPAVRLVVQDHARDEARHHAYFSSLLEYAWPQLDSDRKSALGPLLADFVLVFLQPDSAAMRRHLHAGGLDRDQAEQVVAETYPPAAVLASVRRAARATLRLLERQGVFEDPATQAAFETAGLLG